MSDTTDHAQRARSRVPRDREHDYTEDLAARRRSFVEDRTGVSLKHVGHYSVDPGSLPGNIENFTGVAQVPVGLAGPLLINGEHARGEFFVPLATTEGTLVASYNRGMRLLTESGGVPHDGAGRVDAAFARLRVRQRPRGSSLR